MYNWKDQNNLFTPENTEGDQCRRDSSFNQRVIVSDVLVTKTSEENRTGRGSCRYTLNGRPPKRDRSPSRSPKHWREATDATTVPFSEEDHHHQKKRKKKKEKKEERRKSQTESDSCKRSRVVAEEDAQQEIIVKPHRSPVKTEHEPQQPGSSNYADRVLKSKRPRDEEKALLEETSTENKQAAATLPPLSIFVTSIPDSDREVVCRTVTEQSPPSKRNKSSHVHDPKDHDSHDIKVLKVHRLGFPNPAQICYMNSSLQSLLTLKQFVTDVSKQEDVSNFTPEAELINLFMYIVRRHDSKSTSRKLKALDMFKGTLSIQAPEFQDSGQKDAHEFLTTVLFQMKTVTPMLQKMAAFMGTTYSCPVERNFVFHMHNTRTCKRCGSKSVRQEESTNLSLDLIPGGSVQQMLQEYQAETELEYRCECGGNTSGQRSTFATLPRVLMLHLKRFTFTQFLQLKKLHDPVILVKDLIVSSSQDQACYSLVSVISHLGSGMNKGHYISDGLHPHDDMDAPSDRWLYYNDSNVTETTGAAVCEERQTTAYVLFYQRR